MKHTPICFSIKYSEEIPNFQIILYHLRSSHARELIVTI
nr:MAG TPA: hypothetical protein [Caudoviricetes sp.]DAZ74654.1 MAG TPA: hypothetical protein [Caudoviricetes sp.]